MADDGHVIANVEICALFVLPISPYNQWCVRFAEQYEAQQILADGGRIRHIFPRAILRAFAVAPSPVFCAVE